jgi:flagellar basal-body rod protein FlgF
MDRLIYTAVTGMNASMAHQRMIASNMANAQTIGFRAETMQFTPMTLKGPSLEARAMSSSQVRGAMMDAGALIQTGRALDIAISGDAMLTMQAEEGSEAYTRRGDLSVSPTGLLVGAEGQPLIGQSGPVSVPLGAEVSIAPDGSVLVRDKASPDAPPQVIDRLKLASWRGTRIEKALDGLFRVFGGGVLPTDDAARVQPGALEQSNVKPAQVLVEMVEAQRLFEMRTKLIATAKEIDEGGTSLMRMQS